MKNIKEIAIRYNQRIKSVLMLDYELKRIHNYTDIAMMCKEMLGCLQHYLPGIPYVDIIESEEPSGVSFEEIPQDLILCHNSSLQMINYLKQCGGLHVVNISVKDMYLFRERVNIITENDLLYKNTILEPFNNRKKKLANVLFQYGLMQVFYHEYGHVVDGHIIAERVEKINWSNLERRALEYNADAFSVDQMCKHFVYDNYFEIFESGKVNFDMLLEEAGLMALATHIFLDLFYDRFSIKYENEINGNSDHMPPFLRQYHLATQFAYIWLKAAGSMVNFCENDKDEFNREIMHYLDAYERVFHNGSLTDSYFFAIEKVAIVALELSQVQACWNNICDKLKPHVAPRVELSKTGVFNVVTRDY